MSREPISIWLMCLGLLAGGLATAAAVRVELTPAVDADGTVLAPDATGHLILNFNEARNMTLLQLNARGLEGETSYTIHLSNPTDDGFHQVGAFATNKAGVGRLNAWLDGDHSGHLPAEVRDADGGAVLSGAADAGG